MSKLPFKVLGLSHIGLAPESGPELSSFFSDILQLQPVLHETVAGQKTRTTVFCSNHGKADTRALARLEVVEPIAEDSPIARFLQKRGSGIHHLALRVDDVQKVASYLKEKNIPTTTEAPVLGIHGSLVLFVHPKATSGILIEFVQE